MEKQKCSCCSPGVFILKSLDSDNQKEFLVSCIYKKPKSLFFYPLYLYRYFSGKTFLIHESEVEAILWEERKDGWTVKLSRGVNINGLENIDNFRKLKDLYFSLKAQK